MPAAIVEVTVLRRIALLSALSLAVALAGLPGSDGPAVAAPDPQRVVPVAPGVDRLEYRYTKPSGAPVAAQVLTVRPTEGVRITSALGQGAVPGLERVQAMNQRLQPTGGVAVLNSGFWLNQPTGDPNSYFATGGRLVSESESQGAGARGTFATTPDGRSIIDRVDARVHLRADPEPVAVSGVNRLNRTSPAVFADGADALYLYTPEYGPTVTLPAAGGSGDRGPATVMAVDGMTVAASGPGGPGAVPAPTTAAPGATLPIPADGVLVVAYNRAGDTLRGLVPGSAIQPVTEVRFPERSRDDLWSAVAEGVAAGPLIVRDGAMVDPASWEVEGFTPAHNNGVAPRSAVGVRPDGTTLLVAVDGRQFERGNPALQHSQGLTMAELARFMIDLGAVDAMSLDGGGSTQLSVDGSLRNQPCEALRACGTPRPVASGLVVQHDYVHTATVRLAGSGREATAAAIARAAYPEGSPEAVLAAGGNFPDALAGGPLASSLRAPLLLTGGDALSPATAEALRDLGTERVTLLGGTGALSADLEAELGRLGYAVRRLSGPGRAETAAVIADELRGPHRRVFVAAAGGFADALSAAAPAGMLEAPILLTDRDRLSPATREALRRSNALEVVIVGGTGVISAEVEREVRAAAPVAAVNRLSGADRYGTARAVNEWAEAALPILGVPVDLTGLVVARGDTFPDALAGGPFGAAQQRLLMIVPGDDVRAAPDAAAYLDRRGAGPLAEVQLLGGLGVLSSYQHWQLDQLAR